MHTSIVVYIYRYQPLHTESLLAGKKGPFVAVKQYKNDDDATLRRIN